MNENTPLQLPLFALDNRGRVHYPDKVVVGSRTYHIPNISPDVLATIMERPLKRSEEDRVEEYHTLIADGLSDAEARGTAWPEGDADDHS